MAGPDARSSQPMAEAGVTQLAECISEMLGRITRIHEHELDCLRKENRFLATQAKAARNIKAQHEQGDATPEGLVSPNSPTMAEEVWSDKPVNSCLPQQQTHVPVINIQDGPPQKTSALELQQDCPPQKMSALELRQAHMKARMRALQDSDQEEDLEQRRESPVEQSMHEDPQMHIIGGGSTDTDNYPLLSESSNEEVILPQSLGDELDQKETWTEKQPTNVGSLEQLETIGWEKGHFQDNNYQSTADGGDENDSVELCDLWKARRRSLGHIARRALLLQKGTGPSLPVVESQSTSGVQQASPVSLRVRMCKALYRIWERMVARPSSQRRLIWDTIGMILIGYDVVVIPLQTFDPPPNVFTWSMAWLCTLYWSFDIPCSVCVGYHSKGVLEMRPLRLCKHYTRTWLFFDIAVVGIDWMCTIAENSSVSNNRVGYLRFGRFGRFLRMLRLLRLLKLHGLLVDIFERIHSEFARIMLGIANVLVFIVMVNHVIACGWYWVGTHSFEVGSPSWVVAARLQHRSIAYNYTTSVHWSLTQFTPASMEVVPKNTFERAYNVITLLFAMCTFSSFVSSITNAMTRLRNLNNETVQRATILRQFLKENRIPGKMSNRIWSWLQNTADNSKCRIHEDQVAILPTLPVLLQTELRHAIYKPLLNKHPFFAKFAEAHSDGMRSLYACLVEVGLAAGKELFHCGERANRMWFAFSGRLRYLSEGELNKQGWEAKEFQEIVVRCSSLSSDSETVLGPGQWVSEHPLWIQWQHVGQLTALCQCELFAVKAQKFQETMQYELHGVWQAAKYARCFLQFLHSSQSALTDVWADFQILDDLATRAFTITEDDVPSSSSGESSNQFTVSSPRSRPSPVPWGRISSHRHSRNSVSTRRSRQSQNSYSKDSRISQGSVRKSFGTPSQQFAHPMTGNLAPEAETGTSSDTDVEAVRKGSVKRSERTSHTRASKTMVESI